VIKSQELSNPDSCLNRATANERLFVLLARDAAAPDTLRYWVRKRLALGKNKRDDPQILEALECADLMEKERTAHSPLAAGHDPATCEYCKHPEWRV
jgi:hypothetical protein